MKNQDKNKVRLITGPAHALAPIVGDSSRKLSVSGGSEIVAATVNHGNVPGALKLVTRSAEIVLAPQDELTLTESYIVR